MSCVANCLAKPHEACQQEQDQVIVRFLLWFCQGTGIRLGEDAARSSRRRCGQSKYVLPESLR
jgi:hypothetical protein